MQVRAVDPIGLLVEPDVETNGVANDAGKVRVRQRAQVVHGEDDVLGCIEREEAVDRAGAQAHLGGLGIHACVPLAGLGRVAALLERAAHPDHVARGAGEVDALLRGRGEVGERPERDDRHLAGMPADVRADVAAGGDGGVLGRAELAVLAAQLHVAGAGRAVGVGCRAQPPLERSSGADADGHVAAADHAQDLARVARHVVDLDVAGDAGDAAQVELGAGGGDEQRDHVVDPRVDVQDQRPGRRFGRCSGGSGSASASIGRLWYAPAARLAHLRAQWATKRFAHVTRRDQQRVEVDAMRHPFAIEEVHEVLRCEVARRPRSVRAAAGAAGRGVEASDAELEGGGDVGQRGAARVVEVHRQPIGGDSRAQQRVNDPPNVAGANPRRWCRRS